MSDLHDNLRDLIVRYLDGSCTAADADELNRLLRDDDAARAEFMSQCELAVLVAECPAGSQADAPTERAASAGRTRRFRITPIVYATAAALLLAAAAAAIYVFAINPQSKIRNPRLESPVATLIDATDDVVINDNLANPGGDYASGEYAIESGSAELLLTSRVAVAMHGRTALTIHNPMHAVVAHGSASFHCPPGVVGYTVELPGRSRIVDLGTAFRVDVDDSGDALLRVDEGRVRWEPADPKAAPVVLDAGRFARIIDGRFVDLPVATALDGSDWPATLDTLDADAVYTDGAVRFSGSDTPGPTIVRTLRSDYHRHDWTATFVFTIEPESIVSGPAYIGIGPGDVDHDKYDAPVARPNVLISFRADQRQINVFDDTDTPALLGTNRGRVAHRFRPDQIAGPHRLTIRWDAATQIASCEYEYGDDGAIDAAFAVDASDNEFTADTARVFFGGEGATLRYMTLSD